MILLDSRGVNMNNKGFTLVELLAVVVILASISIVAVVNVSSSLKRRDTRECLEQIAIVKNSAKIYFSLNDDKTSVTLATLIDEGYIDGDNKINKLKKDTDKVNLTANGYEFVGTECS